VLTRADDSLTSLLEAHVQDLRVRRFSRTVENHARLVLPRLFAHLGKQGVRDVRAVTAAHVTSYARSLLRYTTRYGRPLALASRVSFLRAVKRFFAFLAKRRIVLSDPARELTLPNVQRLPRVVLSEAAVARLVAAPAADTVIGKRDRAILEVFYGTGIRLGECQRLDLVDYDPAQKTLWIRNGKGKKDRVVPVPTRAASALDLYLSDARPEQLRHGRETALFLSKSGARLSKDLITLMIRKHARAAGIGVPISAHALRHSCATHLLKGGADIRHIQKLLGHSQLASTAIYTQVEISDLRQVLKRSHPREQRRRRPRPR
jgi:integrase/recombinase XerD